MRDDDLLKAAGAHLATIDGNDLLARLSPRAISRQLAYHHNTIRNHLNKTGGRHAVLTRLVRRAIEEGERLSESNVRSYLPVLKRVTQDRLSEDLSVLVEGELGHDPDGRSRERVLLLAFAIADRDDELRNLLRDARLRRSGSRVAIYDAILQALQRRPRAELDVLAIERACSTYLTGVAVSRTLDTSPPTDREAAEAVANLVLAMSEPSRGTKRSRGPRIHVASSTDEAYAMLVSALKAASLGSPGGVIRHGSLHGQSGSPAPTDGTGPEALKAAMLTMVTQGWEMRRLVSVHTPAEVERQIAIAKELESRRRAVEIRCCLTIARSEFTPIVIGADLASLGLDDPYHNVAQRAILIEDRDAVAVVAEHFDRIWNDKGDGTTYRILGPQGLNLNAIEELTRRVAEPDAR